MDLRRLIGIVRAWLPLLIASVAVAAGAAYFVSNLQPKVYEARATLIVGQSLAAANPDYSQLLVSQRLSTTYAAVATTRPILKSVIDSLELGVTTDELAGRVNANAPADSTLLAITAKDANPEVAADIANTMAEELIAASPAIQGRETVFQASIDADLKATRAQIESTQARIDALAELDDPTPEQDAQLQALEDRLASLRSTYATLLSYASGTSASLLTVIEPAVPGIEPVSPRVLLNTLLAAVLGLLAASGVAFLAEFLDDAIKDPEVVQAVTGLSTLGTIARINGHLSRNEIYRLAPLLYPRSSGAESYRTLRTNVEFASIDAPVRTLLVTSAMPGEGKTITACNLAIVFAQSGRRVLLVDADLRKPGVHIAFELANARGLTTLLRGEDTGVVALAQPTEVANLRVLTTGPLPPNPAELLGSQRMRTVLEALKSDEDLVIFDSPPLQAVSDSAVMSSLVDGTLLVIDSARGRQRAVRLGREALRKAGANVLGAVLNRLPSRATAEYQTYGGYYNDEEADGTVQAPQPSRPPATGPS